MSGWEVREAPVHRSFVAKPVVFLVCPPASRSTYVQQIQNGDSLWRYRCCTDTHGQSNCFSYNQLGSCHGVMLSHWGKVFNSLTSPDTSWSIQEARMVRRDEGCFLTMK